MASTSRNGDRRPRRWSAVHIHGWMFTLRWVGHIGHRLERIRTRMRPRMLALAVAVAALLLAEWWEVLIGYAVVLLLWLAFRASKSVVVETFEDHVVAAGTPAQNGDGATSAGPTAVHRPDTTGMATLLATRLAEMRNIYELLEEPLDAPHPGRPVEGAVEIEDIGDVLRSAFTTQPNLTVGGITLPFGAVMTLLGRLMQSPRLRGAIYGDEQRLTLTAELTMHGRNYVWSLSSEIEHGTTPLQARAAMVEDLAYRVFTDLSLQGQAEWPATRYWLDALKERQACQRTPRDRRQHLEKAEEHLRKALGEDERFYLAAYNLGIVYRQLAEHDAEHREVKSGRFRSVPDEPFLRSAMRAFQHAIDKLDHGRWEAYYGLALCHWNLADEQPTEHRRRLARVVHLCDRAIELRPGRAARAQILDLKASAQRDLGRTQPALVTRHRACSAILRELTLAELSRVLEIDGQHVLRLRNQASQCLLNLALAYNAIELPSIVNPSSRWWPRVLHAVRFRRIRAVALLATELADVDAEAHARLARIAWRWGRPSLAVTELRRAIRIDPDDPISWAAQAQVLAKGGRDAEPALDEAELAIDFARANDEREQEAIAGLVDALTVTAQEARVNKVLDHQRVGAEVAAALELEGDRARDLLYALRRRCLREGLDWETALVERELAQHLLSSGDARDAHRAERLLGTAIERLRGEHGVEVRRWGLLGAQARAIAAQHDRTKDALPLAERGVAIDPLSDSAWRALASVREHGGDYERACDAWHRVLLMDPDNPARHVDLALCQWQHAGWVSLAKDRRALQRDALGHLHTAVRLYDSSQMSERRWTEWWSAMCHWMLGDFAEMPPHLWFILASLEDIDPSPADEALTALTELLLAISYRRTSEFAKAEDYARQAIQHADSAARRGLPLRHDVDERLCEGQRTFAGDRWSLGEVRAWARGELAGCHADRNGRIAFGEAQCRDAERILHALEVSGANVTAVESNVLAERGRLALRRGAAREAVRRLERATRLDPGQASAYVALARSYELQARDEHGEERRRTLDKARESCARAKEIVGEGHPDRVAAEDVERRLAERRPLPATVIFAQTPTADGGRHATRSQ